MSTDPRYPLLSTIEAAADLRRLEAGQLVPLADELRQFLIHAVSQMGGHFAAGLGTVELTVALHYVFDTPHARLVWDVGHQAYRHKVLTGRRDRLRTIKLKDGLAPFPNRGESEFDTFGVGHSSTSISAALDMALASPNLSCGVSITPHSRRGTDQLCVSETVAPFCTVMSFRGVCRFKMEYLNTFGSQYHLVIRCSPRRYFLTELRTTVYPYDSAEYKLKELLSNKAKIRRPPLSPRASAFLFEQRMGISPPPIFSMKKIIRLLMN